VPCTAILDACHPSQRASLQLEFQLIRETTQAGITRSRQNGNDNTWTLWESFCVDLYIDPELVGIDDPIPLLQLFTQQYRRGIIAPSGSAVRSRTVEGALRAVGQAFSTLGCPDPRLTVGGKLDLRLSRQLSAYKKQDPPPHRVKPIALPVIGYAADMCRLAHTPYANALADMLLLGFYFLLRPGEYARTSNPDASPFRICDVHLMINDRCLHPYHANDAELSRVNFVGLEFTNQKNGVRGEIVGLGKSGHHTWYPVLAILNRIRHLRAHAAPLTSPIYLYYSGTWRYIDTTALTQQLRLTVTTLGHQYGLSPSDISVRSLRASGAMALLCARVDTDTIRLLGRWRSDEMLRYLHVQSYPIVTPLASRMLHQVHFSLIPNHHLRG
jgi:hypothetical protein